MIRHTGGLAVGATSTRSNSLPSAMRCASAVAITPSCCPSLSMTRTSRARICWLMRTFSSTFAMTHLLACGRRPAPPPPGEQGNLLELRFPDLEVQLLVAEVGLGAQPGVATLLLDPPRVRLRLLAHRQHAHLHPCEPERQLPRRVLEQDGDESLERAQDRTMDHDRLGLAPVRRDVGELESLGHGAIDLDPGERPRALEHAAEVEADLRGGECALAGEHAHVVAGAPRRAVEDGLGGVPQVDAAEELLRPRLQGDLDAVEPEGVVH